MNDSMIAAMCGVIGSAFITFLTTWGVTRGKMIELERRANEQQIEIVKNQDLIHGLRDIYVSYQHFNEIMNNIKESQRELRDDMKKVLSALSKGLEL